MCGWPPGYQVLCHNCNVAKRILGTCPHQMVDGAIGSTGASIEDSVKAGRQQYEDVEADVKRLRSQPENLEVQN